MKTLRNSVQFIGNVGNDIIFNTLDSGTAFAKFSLATNDYYKIRKEKRLKRLNGIESSPRARPQNTLMKALNKGIKLLFMAR